MRFVPSTPTGSLMMAALEETAAKRPDDLSNDVLSKASDVIEAREDGKTHACPTLEHQIVNTLYSWADAHLGGDESTASEHSATLDALGPHPFDFAGAKTLLADQPDQTTLYEGTYYIPYTNQGADFGIVDHTLKNDAVVGFFGDWGTGTTDAKHLFTEMMKRDPDVLLHLGDIYNAGTPWEIKTNFLDPMDEVCRTLGKTRPPILTIPGNHEYFSLGQGYFEMLKTLNQHCGPDWLQQASYYCLRTADGKWQFIGADTGLQSWTKRHWSGDGRNNGKDVPGLEAAELRWHHDRIAEWGGRTVFMSHHQVVSGDNGMYHNRTSNPPYNYRYWNPNLIDTFDVALPANATNKSATYLDAIDLWLWGHDHWFVPYAENLEVPRTAKGPNPSLTRGRLLGGSARETKATRRIASGLDAWVHTWNGKMALPDYTPANPPGGDLRLSIFNHTYGILDLGTGQLTHYQTPAWEGPTMPPAPGPLRNPILVDDLTGGTAP